MEGVADKERRLSGRNGTEYGTTQEERQRARRKGGNDGEGVSGERKGRVYNS